MSTLTKICVVVLVVLVLLAMPVFITKAMVDPNYRVAYEKEALRAKLHAQAAQVADLATAVAKEQLKTANEDVLELRNQLRILAGSHRTDSTRWNNVITELQADRQKLQGELAKLQSTYRQNSDLLKLQTNNLAKLRDANEKLTRETIALGEQLDAKDAKVERATEQVRQTKERNIELSEEIAKLGAAIALLEKTGAEPAEAGTVDGVRIAGMITEVRGDLASINVGSAKGVKPHMRFYIYRGSDFVGYLRIGGSQEVEADGAAGLITHREVEPRYGDTVSTTMK